MNNSDLTVEKLNMIYYYYYSVYDKKTDNFLGMLARDINIHRNAESVILNNNFGQTGIIRLEVRKIEPSPSRRYYLAPIYLVIDLSKHDNKFERKLREYLKVVTPNQIKE